MRVALHLRGRSRAFVALLDEAEMLDPFLPVWCVEERGVALYALGRYAEAIESLGRLTLSDQSVAPLSGGCTRSTRSSRRSAADGKGSCSAASLISRSRVSPVASIIAIPSRPGNSARLAEASRFASVGFEISDPPLHLRSRLAARRPGTGPRSPGLVPSR